MLGFKTSLSSAGICSNTHVIFCIYRFVTKHNWIIKQLFRKCVLCYFLTCSVNIQTIFFVNKPSNNILHLISFMFDHLWRKARKDALRWRFFFQYNILQIRSQMVLGSFGDILKGLAAYFDICNCRHFFMEIIKKTRFFNV